MEYYSAIKKNEIMPFSASRMNSCFDVGSTESMNPLDSHPW